MSRIRALLLAAIPLAALAVALALPALRTWRAREANEPRGEREVEHAPADWFYAQRADADGQLPHARWQMALQQAAADRARAARAFGANSATALVWQQAGPFNIGGRVTALAVDPAGPIYLGAANGGVWKSVNAGVNWTCVTDAQSI